MTTWGDLRASIREELKDTNEEKYRWSDDLLYLYLRDALNDYSLWFPLREDRVILTLSGTGYSLPIDHVNTLFVECPTDSFLEQRRARPGIRYPARSGKPFFFYTQGGKIYLDSSPLSGDEVLLTYEKVHPAPATAGGTDYILTVPVNDEELMRLYVLAKCYGHMRSRQSALDRFKDRSSSGSNRQDNPLHPETKTLLDEYYEKLYARVGGGTIRLHRTGRMK